MKFLWVVLICTFVMLCFGQKWTESQLLFKSKDSISVSEWKQSTPPVNHLLIIEGSSAKIVLWHLRMDKATTPVVIDTFETGFAFYGGSITGTKDGSQLFAVWSIYDKEERRFRAFGKESLSHGEEWGERIELVSEKDSFSRRRVSPLYIEKSKRLWVFYFRDESEKDPKPVYGVTRAPNSQLFSKEILVTSNLKFASNIHAEEINDKITLIYYSWLNEEIIATKVATSRSGILWEAKLIHQELWKKNVTLFAQNEESNMAFVAVSKVEDGDQNKTVEYSYDLGGKWNKGLSLVPGWMRSVSLRSCKIKNTKLPLLGILAKEKEDLRFSYYYQDPWAQKVGTLPPLPLKDSSILTIKLVCSDKEQGGFQALSVLRQNKEDSLFSNEAEFSPDDSY